MTGAAGRLRTMRRHGSLPVTLVRSRKNCFAALPQRLARPLLQSHSQSLTVLQLRWEGRVAWVGWARHVEPRSVVFSRKTYISSKNSCLQSQQRHQWLPLGI